jgi:hypothetical protein
VAAKAQDQELLPVGMVVLVVVVLLAVLVLA